MYFLFSRKLSSYVKLAYYHHCLHIMIRSLYLVRMETLKLESVTRLMLIWFKINTRYISCDDVICSHCQIGCRLVKILCMPLYCNLFIYLINVYLMSRLFNPTFLIAVYKHGAQKSFECKTVYSPTMRASHCLFNQSIHLHTCMLSRLFLVLFSGSCKRVVE